MTETFKNKLFYKGLIYCFSALYLLVAFISFWHCIAFCLVGNPLWISIMMSFAFEVGLAATLFSILTTDNKNTFVAWILMTFLTFVQVIGNVYSVFKYMVESHTDFYVYIQNSMLHWFVEDVSTNDIMSIIAIILGALLPIVALLMTSMVSNNLKIWLNKKEPELPPSAPIPDNEYSNKPEFPVEVEEEHEDPNENDFQKEREEFYNGLESLKEENEPIPQDYSSETSDFETVDSYDLGIDNTEESPEEDPISLAEVINDKPVSSIFDNNINTTSTENEQPETKDQTVDESVQSGETEEAGTVEENQSTENDPRDNKGYIGPGMRITSSKITKDVNKLPEKIEGESIIGKDIPPTDPPAMINLQNPYKIDSTQVEENVKNNIGTPGVGHAVKSGPFTIFSPKK